MDASMEMDLSALVAAQIAERLEVAMAGFQDKLDHAASLERLKRKECLDPEEVEALYGFKVATLATWRCRGGGPSYVKNGGVVLYRAQDMARFVADRLVKR